MTPTPLSNPDDATPIPTPDEGYPATEAGKGQLGRRSFLTQAAVSAAGIWAAGVAGPAAATAKEAKVLSGPPAARIRLGVIGLNGIGWHNMHAAINDPDTRVTAIADMDPAVTQKRLGEWPSSQPRPTVYTDYTRLLADRNVDAVIISTPDHWHTLMTAHALEAGKHVYIEKPLANSITESRYLDRLSASRPNLIVQVGMQQRAARHWGDAISHLQAGSLGKVRQVKCWYYSHWKSALPVKADGPPPANIDYNQWLGPAPRRPFNENRFHFQFRWFWDYAGGLMTDWGVHLIDMGVLGMGNPYPLEVSAQGGKMAYPDDDKETPDTLTALYRFPDFLLSWEHVMGIGLGPYNRRHGVAFIGENGTLVVNRDGWEVLAELTPDDRNPRLKTTPIPFHKAFSDGRKEHLADWLAAIRKGPGAKVLCPMADGARVAEIAHLGNIAYRLGRTIRLDPKTGEIVGDGDALRLAQHTYHNGYTLPKI